jgi:hypothetical protein
MYSPAVFSLRSYSAHTLLFIEPFAWALIVDIIDYCLNFLQTYQTLINPVLNMFSHFVVYEVPWCSLPYSTVRSIPTNNWHFGVDISLIFTYSTYQSTTWFFTCFILLRRLTLASQVPEYLPVPHRFRHNTVL